MFENGDNFSQIVAEILANLYRSRNGRLKLVESLRKNSSTGNYDFELNAEKKISVENLFIKGENADAFLNQSYDFGGNGCLYYVRKDIPRRIGELDTIPLWNVLAKPFGQEITVDENGICNYGKIERTSIPVNHVERVHPRSSENLKYFKDEKVVLSGANGVPPCEGVVVNCETTLEGKIYLTIEIGNGVSRILNIEDSFLSGKWKFCNPEKQRDVVDNENEYRKQLEDIAAAERLADLSQKEARLQEQKISAASVIERLEQIQKTDSDLVPYLKKGMLVAGDKISVSCIKSLFGIGGMSDVYYDSKRYDVWWPSLSCPWWSNKVLDSGNVVIEYPYNTYRQRYHAANCVKRNVDRITFVIEHNNCTFYGLHGIDVEQSNKLNKAVFRRYSDKLDLSKIEVGPYSVKKILK